MAKKYPAGDAPQSEEMVFITVEELVTSETDPSTALVPDKSKVEIAANALVAYYNEPQNLLLDSKEAVEKMRYDYRVTVKFRTSLDKRRLFVNKTTNEEGKWFLGLWAPTEAKLKKRLDDYDAAEALKLKLAAEAKAKLIQAREAQLHSLGAIWTGSNYQIGTCFAGKSDLEVENETVWDAIVERFTVAKAEKDREAAVQAQKLTTAARKEQLMELGATVQWRLAGKVVGKDTEGAVGGFALGDAWAEKSDFESAEARWKSIVLHAFEKAAKKIEDDRVAAEKAAAQAERLEAENAVVEPVAGSTPVVESKPVGLFEEGFDAPATDHKSTADKMLDHVAEQRSRIGGGGSGSPISKPVAPMPHPENDATAKRVFLPLMTPLAQGREQHIYLSGAHRALELASRALKSQGIDFDAKPTMDRLLVGKVWWD